MGGPPLFKNDSNKIGRFIKGIECVTKSNVHFNWILQKSVAALTGRRCVCCQNKPEGREPEHISLPRIQQRCVSVGRSSVEGHHGVNSS